MADISKIKLPSGEEYNLKDTIARQTAGGGLQFRGVTTTQLSDGATATSYVIGSVTRTAANGDMVVYGSKEFVFSTSDNKWHELGDNTPFKALAYEDNATASYQPAGSVTFTNGTVTGTISTTTTIPSGKSKNYTPAGTISIDGTTNKTAAVTTASGTATYQPGGSVAAPTISVKVGGATTTISNPSSKTVVINLATMTPSDTTHPSNPLEYATYDQANETLVLNQVGTNTGDSINTSDVTVKTGDATYQATAPTFTGTAVRLVTGNIAVPSSLSFTGTDTLITQTASVPASAHFTGTTATITVS